MRSEKFHNFIRELVVSMECVYSGKQILTLANQKQQSRKLNAYDIPPRTPFTEFHQSTTGKLRHFNSGGPLLSW